MREQKTDESIYRFGYQGEFSERDLETGWSHFELREYDPVMGRWTSKDPAGQYYSPYVGMGNNPISGVDPDGGTTFDQGVDKNGKIVFDNGIDNGNVYRVNDGYTEKITSLDQLKANSVQLTSNWKWIGTEAQMRDYVQSQLSFANASFTKIDIVQSFSEYEKPANAMEAQMAPLAFKNGKVIASPFGKGKGELDVKNIPGSSNLILGNVYNVRSTLEHESRHQVQFMRVTTFNKYKEYKYFIENDAVNFQMKGKWFNNTSSKYQTQIKAYPGKFK